MEKMIFNWMAFQVTGEKWAGSFGMTLNEVWVLWLLDGHPEGLRQIDMVRITGLSKQTLCYLAHSLINKGYITYKKEGGKSHILVLTVKGETLWRPMLAEIQEIGIGSLKHLTPEECVAFDKLHNDFIAKTILGFADGVKKRKETHPL